MKKFSLSVFISLFLIASAYSVSITTYDYPSDPIRIYAETRPAYFRGDVVYTTLIPDTVSVFVENDRNGRCVNRRYTGTHAVQYLVDQGYFMPYTYCSNTYYIATPRYISYYDRYYPVRSYVSNPYYYRNYRTEPVRTVTTYVEPTPHYYTYSTGPRYVSYRHSPSRYRTVRYVDGRSCFYW